ncbi:histidinol-phosphate aminotransferase family protein [Parashewanella curva]|uniref:Aminotransferase n=1 Tax=Parashewanella curva TaxID=2338552 RepID=A0A3L8Q1E8_9GAMM|nr:aminotransferase class I/II-fold pyridoxal phosphate-dependent enzyme [Parashewanella curva]RLV61415.1 histidinol-phosphate aminotransferase family protein [Parashewanella curva]
MSKLFESLNEQERITLEKLLELKKESGTHSPSPSEIDQILSPKNILVDACFLSNPYGTDLYLRELNKLMSSDACRGYIENYPSQNHSISKKLSNVLSVNEKNVFVGNGAIEIIELLLKEVIQGKIIVNLPTFSSYYEFCEEKERLLLNYLKKSNNYQLELSDIEGMLDEAEALVVINPNNPDAQYTQFDKLEEIIQACKRKDVKVIIDESFIHLKDGFNSYQDASHNYFFENYDNVIIVKSLSKDFGIAGLRLGYMLADESTINRTLAHGKLWNVSGFAEHFVDLLSANDYMMQYEACRKQHIDDIKELGILLNNIDDVKVLPTNTNFYLIELPDNIDPQVFCYVMLIRYNVLVRGANDKVGLDGNYIRVATRRPDENKLVVKAISDTLSDFKKLLD